MEKNPSTEKMYDEMMDVAATMSDDQLEVAQTTAKAAMELLTIFRATEHQRCLDGRTELRYARDWMQSHIDAHPEDLDPLESSLAAQSISQLDRMRQSLNFAQQMFPSPVASNVAGVLESFHDFLRREVSKDQLRAAHSWLQGICVDQNAKFKVGMLLQAQNVVTIDMMIQALEKSISQIDLIRGVAKTVNGL